MPTTDVSADRLLLRLHFSAPGVHTARPALVAAVRGAFDVPDDIELWQVRGHWLNVNPTLTVDDELLAWLPGQLPDCTLGAYPMDERSRTHPAVVRFLAATGLPGTPS